MSRHDPVIAATASPVDHAIGPSPNHARRLMLPDQLDLTPVDDRDVVSLNTVGLGLDEAVSGWLEPAMTGCS